MASEQQHRAPSRSDAPETDDVIEPAQRNEALDADVDAILDEIDDVLEQNAEEFVRGFVQKGGQ